MGAVGVIHQQGNLMGVTHPSKARNIRQDAEIVRAGDVDGLGLRVRLQSGLHVFRVKPSCQKRACVRPGTHPHRLDTQQGHGIDGAPMNHPAGNHRSPLGSRQPEHGLDAQGASSRGKQGGPAVEQFFSFLFRSRNTAVCLKEAVGIRKLRQIQIIEVLGQEPAFMPRRVKRSPAFCQVPLQSVV